MTVRPYPRKNCAKVRSEEQSLTPVILDHVQGSDANGYLTGLSADAYVSGQSFAIADQAGTAPTNWNPNFTLTTTTVGNYSATVYAPATYEYDFTSISGNYDTTVAPKLTCTSTVATVGNNLNSCLTQPCTIVKNMSFGFWKIFGGWWQIVGGSAYGEAGIQSYIPPMMTAPQRLILPDTNGRVGVLSYGVVQPARFGSNTNARVSDDLWEVQSTYAGLRYDYNFYNTRMDIFASKTWTDDSISTYDDGGTGYQIFKSSTGIDLNSPVTLNAGQKIVILVNGNVNVNTNITVNPGSFISIIANGTITFNSTVTKAQGWFVGENINVPCKDTGAAGCDKDDAQFDGQGTFVGWSGVSLGRDQGLPNNQAPSEKFTYRTDMLLNAPEPMKVYTKRFSPFVPYEDGVCRGMLNTIQLFDV